MRKNTAFHLAASTLVIGATTTGCTSAGYRPTMLSANFGATQAEQAAERYHASSQRAIQKGKLDKALVQAERAVELSPRDVGYRMVLGDLYLKNGRFVSAEQTFVDVLTLNPGNPRASLSVALAQIAQGKNVQAVAQLDQLALTAAPGDLGLAYALAGQIDRAVTMLEGAARAPGADGRVRQNLALAYALAGDWPKARAFAAQDVSPAELGGRLQQWAAFAQPKAPHSQVASLLGVDNVVQDSGQPAQLALAPAVSEPVAVAEASLSAMAEQPAVAAVDVPASASVAAEQVLAEAMKVETPAPVDAAIEQAVTEARYAEAAESLVKPTPEMIRAAAPASAPLPAFKPAVERTSFAPLPRKTGNGRFVVQIGAFKTQIQTEKAWLQAQTRYSIADREPLSTTVSIAGKGTFHRLSVSGFHNAAEASRLCSKIKSKGGACFVRTNAGDSPVQWASRQSRSGG